MAKQPRGDAIGHPDDAAPTEEETVTPRQLAEDLYALCLAGLVRLDGDEQGQLRALILDDNY